LGHNNFGYSRADNSGSKLAARTAVTGVALPKRLQVGLTILVCLHDDREVKAKITKIVDSVAGRKIHIRFRAFALTVEKPRQYPS
jgi:hypothetical protein